MGDLFFIVNAGTSLDVAFHMLSLLFRGFTHFGGFGSYTVMITS
jgi:hypothetical protein